MTSPVGNSGNGGGKKQKLLADFTLTNVSLDILCQLASNPSITTPVVIENVGSIAVNALCIHPPSPRYANYVNKI